MLAVHLTLVTVVQIGASDCAVRALAELGDVAKRTAAQNAIQKQLALNAIHFANVRGVCVSTCTMCMCTGLGRDYTDALDHVVRGLKDQPILVSTKACVPVSKRIESCLAESRSARDNGV